MKKKLSIMLLIAITLLVGGVSCKKEKTEAPLNSNRARLSFEADPSSPDRSVQVPSSVTLKTLLKTGAVKGGVLTGGWITFDSKGAFRPDRDIKNFFMRIKDQSTVPATIIYTTPVYSSVASVNTLPQLSKNIEETKTYNVEFSFDVLSSATDNAAPEDSLILGVGFYYSHKDAAFDTVRAVVQRVCFSTNPSSTLSAVFSPSSPIVANVLDNQELPLLVVDFTSTGGVSTLTKEVYKFEDPQVLPAISSLKMYDGATLVASATASGGNSFTFNQSITVPASKALKIQAVISSVDQTVSGRSLRIIQDRFEYTDAGGAIKFSDVDIVGKEQYVFAAIPTFTKVTVSNAPLVDSTTRELSVMTVSSSRTLGLKTYCYEIKLNDPNNNNTLLLKEIKLFEGSVDVTSQYKRFKQNGVEDSIFTELDSKLFFTKISGNGESVVTGGVPKTLKLTAKIIGFSDPLKTDNISIEFLGDFMSIPFDHRFVNTGLGVAPSRLFNTNAPSASASLVHLVWTDHSAGTQHSSAENISTPDHFCGAAGNIIFSGSGKTYLYQ